eukprot:7748456-Alexandrium_andersonii.AAC.1
MKQRRHSPPSGAHGRTKLSPGERNLHLHTLAMLIPKGHATQSSARKRIRGVQILSLIHI